MDNEYLDEYIEEYVNEIIGDDVAKYKNKSYDYLDEVKLLIFLYLMLDIQFKEFVEKLNGINSKYDKQLKKMTIDDMEEIGVVVSKTNDIETTPNVEVEVSKIELLKSKLDKTSQGKARDIFIRRITNYYKNTSKTLTKEYIDKKTYLSSKLSKYDKIEKVVPYYNKHGKVVAYHDIASYNSMVQNTNLTSQAWNTTLNDCIQNKQDLVYVPPHPYSCDLCQPYQGRFYSLTGITKGYPLLEEALYENGGGLKHPNCKHPIEEANNQVQTNDYSSELWVERYDAKQKVQALQLKAKRLRNEKKIYKELENQAEVDKINKKLNKIRISIKEQQEIMKY